MSTSNASHAPGPRATPCFATTLWSVVLAAGRTRSSEATAALERLCNLYWRPLHVFAQSQGWSPADAEDLTQQFFARLLERNVIAGAVPEKGRFRSFLLTVFKRFLANEWRRQHAAKRGGFERTVTLDGNEGESRSEARPIHDESPDVLFDRQWALVLLDRVLSRLRHEYVESGRARLFECLEVCLTRDESALSYADIARELALTEAAVKMAMQRLRARYRVLLREEISETVASPGEIEAELRDLFAVFQR